MKKNVTSKLILPEIVVKRNPPVNLKPGDEIYFQHEYQRKLPPVHVWNFKNVNVASKGIVFRNFNVFAPSLIDNSLIKKYGYRYILSNYIKQKKYTLSKNEKYILVFDEWSNGYFHWFCDVLPRLMTIQSLLPECVLLLPENFDSQFIKESLKIITCKRIEIVPSNSYVHVPNLIMPEHVSPTGNYNIKIINELREKISLLYKKQDFSLGDKIFVSRKKAPRRKIINEHEIIELLTGYGFKTVFFEDHTLQEQFCIANQAKYMIAQHGSALTNILFMKPGTSVLEFKKQGDKYNLCYYSLASELNLNYYYQFGISDDTATNDPFDNRTDIFIDINQLENNLKHMLGLKTE